MPFSCYGVKILTTLNVCYIILRLDNINGKLGSVAGPVIQANGRLMFENDLRSGGLLYFTAQRTSVRTEFADSMVNMGEPGGG